MAITTITISSKGQVVIPKEIRDELHWDTGHELTIETTDSGLLLKSSSKEKKIRLEDLRGYFKYDGPPVSNESLCKPVENTNDWEESEKRSR